jgi:hypothetical protein
MNVEIHDNTLRIKAHDRCLVIHCRERDGVHIISFELGDGRILRSGPLPDVEMSKRDTLLRHRGNRLEQID